MVTVAIIGELKILILLKQNTKQNNTEKSEKINSFQFKKQCRAVICFSKFWRSLEEPFLRNVSIIHMIFLIY